jgi:hypothetical protein
VLFLSITIIKYLLLLLIANVTYCLNSIYGPFEAPSPHGFPSECLTSGFNPKETYAKIAESQKVIAESTSEVECLTADYQAIKKARTLDFANIPENKNNILKDLKEEYPHFFDENTNKEGLKQIHHYTKEEIYTHNAIIEKHKKKITDWHKELREFYKENPSNSSSSSSDVKKEIRPNNNQNILPLFSIYFNSSYLVYFYRSILYLFELILPLLGIIVSLDLISISIPTFLVLFSENFFNRLLFLLSCLRVYKNIRRFIRLFNFIRYLMNTTSYPDFLLLVLITVFHFLLTLLVTVYLERGFFIDILLCT